MSTEKTENKNIRQISKKLTENRNPPYPRCAFRKENFFFSRSKRIQEVIIMARCVKQHIEYFGTEQERIIFSQLSTDERLFTVARAASTM